jgi:hypothetical protein
VLCYSSSGWFEVEAGATAPELVGAAIGVVAGSRHAQEIDVRRFLRKNAPKAVREKLMEIRHLNLARSDHVRSKKRPGRYFVVPGGGDHATVLFNPIP